MILVGPSLWWLSDRNGFSGTSGLDLGSPGVTYKSGASPELFHFSPRLLPFVYRHYSYLTMARTVATVKANMSALAARLAQLQNAQSNCKVDQPIEGCHKVSQSLLILRLLPSAAVLNCG